MSTLVDEPASASAFLQPSSQPPSPSTPLSGIWKNLHIKLPTWISLLIPVDVNISSATASYSQLLEELALVGPRIARKFGAFIVTGEDDIRIPSTHSFIDADRAASFLIEGDRIPVMNLDFSPDLETRVTAPAPDSAAATSITQSESPGSVGKMTSDSFRSLGGILSFAFSKWAISSVAMTIIMNRTHVYARTRRRIRLSLLSRLVLRLPPIILLAHQSLNILRSIHCQTSPNFSQLRWGNSAQSSDLMFAFDLPFLHWMSSTILLGASDRSSCLAVQMIPSKADYHHGGPPQSMHGSLSILWPVFLSICVSWFVECLSCAMEGRVSGTETDMSLLETSLAFSEAEGAISGQINWDTLSKAKSTVSAMGATTGTTITSASEESTGLVLTRAMILNRVNTSPEMLVVALLACLGHMTSNTLGIFNLQARYRLANTGVWAICFMAMLITSWSVFSFDDISSQSLLRLPTVCLLGWVPHMMLFAGMTGCLLIYGLTVLLLTLSMDDQGMPASLSTQFAAAMENMQARISLTELRVNGQIDFYTALLRIGFAAVSLASETVYLQEDRCVGLKPYTWLEEKRLQEFQSISPARRYLSSLDIRYDDAGTIGLIPVEYDVTIPANIQNGYARQRSAQSVKNSAFPDKRKRDGIGATEKRNKLLMAVDLLLTMFHLVAAVSALSLLALFSAIGIAWRPSILVRIAQSISPKQVHIKEDSSSSSLKGMRGGTIAGIAIPFNEDVDVEAEVRRARTINSESGELDETDLDRRLYRWWAKGGVWGENDASGDYQPVDEEDDDIDHTSEVSDKEDDDEDVDGDSGPLYSTQLERWRESSPFADTPMAPVDLARLLHPQTPEEREAARALSAHLTSDTIMTRSRFRRMEQIQRLRLLIPKEQRERLRWKDALDTEEEERLFEAFILTRRDVVARNVDGNESSWRDGGAGMGEDGPQCVVCQGESRTIIVWPCRCLSLCDGCRIELAMKNYDKCVCCRREVGSFSRIFVP